MFPLHGSTQPFLSAFFFCIGVPVAALASAVPIAVLSLVCVIAVMALIGDESAFGAAQPDLFELMSGLSLMILPVATSIGLIDRLRGDGFKSFRQFLGTILFRYPLTALVALGPIPLWHVFTAAAVCVLNKALHWNMAPETQRAVVAKVTIIGVVVLYGGFFLLAWIAGKFSNNQPYMATRGEQVGSIRDARGWLASKRQRRDTDKLDSILAKVHRHGLASLSKGEREFLERYSRSEH